MNTSGVKSTIDINVNTSGLQSAIQQVKELSKEEQKLAKVALDLALRTEKVATQQAKTNIALEKERLEAEKTTAQIIKNSNAKEQNALKTEKLQLQIEKLNQANSKSSDGFGLASEKLLRVGVNFNNLTLWGKKVADMFMSVANKSIDYVETLNLFEVSIGKTVLIANDFTKQMAEAFNIDDEKLKSAMGTFNLLGTQFGLTNGQALEWSETLTKLAVDTSSLRNTDLTTALTKIRAGISGEIEPLRQWGIDLTENTLRQEALANGITKSYSAMSYGEKSLLRYSALLRQTTADQGDFARTLDSPAQLLKQIKEQFEALARAIGNLFLPLLKQVLPYILAVIMALKEVVIWLGTIFGINVQDISLKNLESGSKNIANNIASSVKSAKELKKWLGGYDVLNNVTPQNKSTSGTSGVGIGIDPEFFNLLKTYDNGMKNVSSRAREIRDNIMSWLGFIYDAEKGTYQLKDGWQNIHTIVSLIGGALALWGIPKIINLVVGIGEAFSGVLGIIKAIGDFTGLSTAFNGISTAISGAISGTFSWGTAFKFIIANITTVVSALGGIVSIVVGISETFKGFAKIIDGDVVSGIWKVIEGVALIVAGVALLAGGWAVALGAGVVAGLAFLASWLTEDKAKILDVNEAQKLLIESQTNLNQAVNDYDTALSNVQNTREALTEAEKALTEAEKEQASTGEELYNKIADGTIKVSEMSDAQFELYNAYVKNKEAEDQLTESKMVMEEAQKNNIKASIENQLAIADESGEYGNLKDSIYDAMEKGMISTGEARDYFERAMGDMSDDSKQTFLEDIPDNIKDGIDPDKYDSNWTKFKKSWSGFWSDVGDDFKQNWDDMIENMSNLGEKIGGAISGAWTWVKDSLKGLWNNIADWLNDKASIKIPAKVAEVLNIEGGKLQLFTLPKFEMGGMPDIGSLFVAGEGNSTEFVGNVGGRTNVINEAQLENALYRAYVRANGGQSNDKIVVENYIGGNKTDSILTKRSRRRNNITGGDESSYG